MSMRELFRGFYGLSPKDEADAWQSAGTLFVFDANVLTSLYRYTEQTREDLLTAIEMLGNRAWLPYFAAWEYQRNRFKAIAQDRQLVEDVRRQVQATKDSAAKKNWESLGLYERHQELHELTVAFRESVQEKCDELLDRVKEIARDHPDIDSPDSVRDRLDQLFEGKVGSPLPQGDIDRIESEGEKRFEAQIPPGYRNLST